MTRPRLVLGYTWRDGAARLRLGEVHGSGGAEHVVAGDLRLGIRERRCIGYRQGRARQPCPDHAVPVRARCEACERRDGFRPCLTCDGFRCPPLQPSIARMCQQVHHLYLACFGDEVIKVGTASAPRREARVVEQGPLAAAHVAAGPGPMIKQIEHLASTRTSLTEAMRRTRKRALLASGMSRAEARERVIAAAGILTDALPFGYDHLLHPPAFVAVPPLARQTRATLASAEPIPVDTGVLVHGRVVGAVGQFVVLDEPAGRFVLDLADLKARIVDLGPQAVGRRPRVQLNLF